MTDAYGAAAVTAVLRRILADNLKDDAWLNELSDPSVTARPPDLVLQDENQAGLNLFLYRVTSNQGWPNRGQSHPEEARRSPTPILALDLHYMLTALSPKDFQTDVLLGHAAQTMEEHAILPGSLVRKQLKNLSSGKKFDAFLESGLADQIEQVKITPRFLDDEALSKIWSSIQAEFRPSVFYDVSTVLISRDRKETPSRTVQKSPSVHVTSSKNPAISDVQAVREKGSNPTTYVPADLLVPGGFLRVTGTALAADHVRLRIEDHLLDTDALKTQNKEELVFQLPTDVAVGGHTIQVVHLFEPNDGNQSGTPSGSEPHILFETNAASIVVHPTNVTVSGTDTIVEVNVEPNVEKGQRGYLLLHPTTGSQPDAPPPEMVPLREVSTLTNWMHGKMDHLSGASSYKEATLQIDGAYGERTSFTDETEERIVSDIIVEELSATEANVTLTVTDKSGSTVGSATVELAWTDSQGNRIEEESATITTDGSGNASTTFSMSENGIYRARVLTVTDGTAVYNPFDSSEEAQLTTS